MNTDRLLWFELALIVLNIRVHPWLFFFSKAIDDS
jgi:hypothetical protein